MIRPPRRSPALLFAAALSAGSVAWLLWRLDPGELGAAFGRARPWPYLPLAVASYLLGHLARGERCQLLASRTARVRRATATNVVVIGYAGNNLMPLRLGEALRAVMLSERSGMSVLEALVVTAVERLLDAVAIVALVVLAAPSGWPLRAPFALALVLAAAAVLVAAFRPSLVAGAASAVGRRLGPSRQAKLLQAASGVTQALGTLREPGPALMAVVLSGLVWICEAGLFFFLLPAFGLPASPGWAALVMGATNLALWLPASPAYVGTFHLACMGALVALGVPEAVGASYALVLHLAFAVPITLWGVAALAWYGQQRQAVWRLVGRARRGPQPGETAAGPLAIIGELARPLRPPEPPAWMAPLVEALVPIDRVPAARAQVTGDVAAYVHGQLESLAPALRAGAAAALWLLRVQVALSCGRPFQRAPAAARQGVVDGWHRWYPTRQVLRAVRGPALLAFWEHPVLRGRDEAAKEVARAAR